MTYPTLNDRPIDQWKITELKDELRQRNLPITGLKDDLVRRLFEAIQGEENADSVTLLAEGLEERETPDSVDASVCKASGQPNVDDVSEVITQGEDLVISVTESINESLVPTTEAIQEAVIGAAETDLRTLNADTEVKFSLDMAATDENCCKPDGISEESASGAVRNDIVEKTSEDITNRKMIVDDVPSDSSIVSTTLDVDVYRKMVETSQSAVIGPEEASQGTIDAVTEIECSLVDEAASDSSGVNTVKEVNPHSQCDYNAIEETSVDETSMKMAVVDVSDISIKLGVDVDKKMREATQGAKQEIVKPTEPSIGDCLQVLDDDKELHKNGSMEESGFTSNMDLDTKQDSAYGSSPEKCLDLSPNDDSMGEDLMENVHDVGGKSKVTLEAEHVFKELNLIDTIIEDSSVHATEAVAEDKPPNLTEKRKSEGHEVIANDKKIKRRCQYDVDAVNTFDQQASKLTGTSIPKVIRSSIKRSCDRSNSTVNGDPPMERIVPPPKKLATTSLRIDGFVRPFTLKTAQQLLGKTGSISSFWMDHIKTHCYVTYLSVEEAVATRNAVYNLHWPLNNGGCLVAEFVDPQEVKLKLEPPPPPPVPISSPSPSTGKAPCQQFNANQTILPHAATTSRGLLATPAPLAKLPPTSDPATARERFSPPPEKLKPAWKLDDLFKTTKAYPRIYYMPLSEEEVLAKYEAR